jgi:type II secretory pathway component PulJ
MTLIEILVVVVLSSLVMGVVISFAVALMRSDRNVKAFAVRNERLSDLAAALRSDLRQAAEASLPSAKTLAIELSGGREIQYVLIDGGCRRVLAVAGPTPPQRELLAVGGAQYRTH